MPKFEIFHSIDAEGNSAVSLESAEAAHEACAEYNAGPVRTVCLALDAELPTDDTDEDTVDVIDVEVPEQEGEEEEGAETAEEEGEEAPAEVHAPAERPAAELTA